MITIAKGQVLSKTGKVLDIFLADQSLGDSLLRDPTSLSFALLDANGKQVFPEEGVQTVDLAAHKIGRGHFAAVFTVPDTAPLGAAEIE